MVMKAVGFNLILVALCAGGAACRTGREERPPTTSAGPYRSDAVADPTADPLTPTYPVRILNINEESLTVEDVLEPLMPKLREQAAVLPPQQLQRFVRERVRVELITQVQDVLLYQEASKGITDQILGVVDRYVDQEIRDRVTREFGGRQTRFEVHLASMGMTLEDAREKVRRRIVIVKYLQDHVVVRIADPTRQELLDYYNTNIESYTQQSSRELCMIDIPKGDDAQASRRAIEEARSRLDAGEDFRNVARGLSRGIHAAEGGSWGQIKSPLHGRYAEPSAIFFKLAEGRTSGVVETDDAFFIVMAADVIESETRPFVDVQPELVQRYRNAQFELLRSEEVRELLEKAAIEPREDLFLRTVVDTAVAQLARGGAR
jgi:parvulin-like peptidyl-prolyl isomerase